jgi:5'-phosphate synthase pdxT subunit
VIGVLAIQGAFKEHRDMLRSLKVETKEVRTVSDLESLDGLIIPGGESTTILKFLKEGDLYEAIQKSGLPMFGTCAGVIVLAEMGLIDIQVERNAYGRQAESFIEKIKLSSDSESFEGVFIRAPKITSVGADVQILGEFENSPVLVQQGNVLVSTFHPELTDDDRVHKLFLLLFR